MSRICLNSIVRNEIANLPRMLESVAPVISSYAILDTGSTDGTPEFIEAFFKRKRIPGVVLCGRFENFSQARNDALELAEKCPVSWDYLLLADADMELVANNRLPELSMPSYAVLQKQGEMAYWNVRLVKNGAGCRYYGVTHEYISVPGEDKLTQWWFRDHACGSNRPNKFKRDIDLLSEDLKRDPNNDRTWFYLAQSYRDAGDLYPAINAYEKRIALGGWDEEVWYSRLQIARCWRALKEYDKFILAAQEAYSSRPWRPEPLYDLSHHFREVGKNALSFAFADAASKIPYPKDDVLFIEGNIQKHGLLEEKSIAGFYQPFTWNDGFEACNELSLMKDAPHNARETARDNMAYYLRPLDLPSLQFMRVPFAPEPGWVATNPSVAVAYSGGVPDVKMVVRTVNYRIRSDGSYDMQGDTAIRTRNWMLHLDQDLVPKYFNEIVMPEYWPAPAFDQVLGWEDMRLIRCKHEWWVSATVLERTQDAWREQWLARVSPDGILTDEVLMQPKWPKRHEKNWMPFVDLGKVLFMYDPGTVIDRRGELISQMVPLEDVSTFKGGGQLVQYKLGWLGIIHESRIQPGGTKRYYQHRFCWWNSNYELKRVSKPFVFFERQIEFAAGLAFLNNDLLISFGVDDCEAWIARVSAKEVEIFLWS